MINKGIMILTGILAFMGGYVLGTTILQIAFSNI